MPVLLPCFEDAIERCLGCPAKLLKAAGQCEPTAAPGCCLVRVQYR